MSFPRENYVVCKIIYPTNPGEVGRVTDVRGTHFGQFNEITDVEGIKDKLKQLFLPNAAPDVNADWTIVSASLLGGFFCTLINHEIIAPVGADGLAERGYTYGAVDFSRPPNSRISKLGLKDNTGKN
jgi:hypothetical protein